MHLSFVSITHPMLMHRHLHASMANEEGQLGRHTRKQRSIDAMSICECWRPSWSTDEIKTETKPKNLDLIHHSLKCRPDCLFVGLFFLFQPASSALVSSQDSKMFTKNHLQRKVRIFKLSTFVVWTDRGSNGHQSLIRSISRHPKFRVSDPPSTDGWTDITSCEGHLPNDETSVWK